MPAEMTTCRSCGATVQDEVFCDGCGALLPAAPSRVTEELTGSAQPASPAPDFLPWEAPSWESAPQEAAPRETAAWQREPPTTEPLPGGTEPPPRAADTQPSLILGDPGLTAPPVEGRVPEVPPPGGDRPASVQTGTTLPNRPVPAEPFPGLPDPDQLQWRARSLIVPVADPSRQGRDLEVRPVLPGLPEPAVHAVRALDVEVATGPPCPWCGTPNPLDRHFCRRCAMLLATRPDPAHLPWWRRMFVWTKRIFWRRREMPYAGQRPRLRRGYSRLVRWTVIAVLAGVVIFAADAWAGTAVTDVKDHFSKRSPVQPNAVYASRSDPRHPASLIDDPYNNTWWGTGVTGDGAGTYVDATFDQPINLLDIIIIPGAGAEPDQFDSESRPETIKVTLTDASAGSTSSTITLADTAGPQTFGIHGSDVSTVRLTLESAYSAASANSQVAIADVEFFASSGG